MSLHRSRLSGSARSHGSQSVLSAGKAPELRDLMLVLCSNLRRHELPELGDRTMDIGAQLRTAREAKGLSIGTLAERTRVPARALAAIELNDQSSLPPHPFGRGFVRTYAEEVDLDPDRLVRDFFAQFPAQPAAGRATVARDAPEPVLAAVVAVDGHGNRRRHPVGCRRRGGGARTPGRDRSRTRNCRHDRSVAGRSGSHRPRPSLLARREAAPAPAAAAAARHASSIRRAITVVLSMSRPCWVAATVDGQRTIYRVLQPGDRQTLVAERDMTIRFGDAGAVAWTINGRDPGAPGANGAVRDVQITPENAASVR